MKTNLAGILILCALVGCSEHPLAPAAVDWNGVESAGPDKFGVVCYHLRSTDTLSCIQLRSDKATGGAQ